MALEIEQHKYNKQTEFKNYINYNKLRSVLKVGNYFDIYDEENIHIAVNHYKIYRNKLNELIK